MNKRSSYRSGPLKTAPAGVYVAHEWRTTRTARPVGLGFWGDEGTGDRVRSGARKSQPP
jgi:hypothetical protein